MEKIKKHWKTILICLLVVFSLNKCTVACNRDTKINKQQTELTQKDSIIKVQADSLKYFEIRWDENQRGQANYQDLATGTKQDLMNQINALEKENAELKSKVNKLEKDNSKLVKENTNLQKLLENYHICL